MKHATTSYISVDQSKASKLPTKQSLHATESATAQDTRLQGLQDRAASGDPDVAEIAEADIFREFGDRDNGE